MPPPTAARTEDEEEHGEYDEQDECDEHDEDVDQAQLMKGGNNQMHNIVFTVARSLRGALELVFCPTVKSRTFFMDGWMDG